MAFKKTAASMNELSTLIGNREKVKARDITYRTRLNMVFPITLEGEQEYIIISDTTYFYAPSSLKRIIEAELKENGGSLTELNSQFEAEPTDVYFTVKNLKNNKEFIETHII